jgi:serine-type D-Ala-D-Ala carboxypeptidase
MSAPPVDAADPRVSAARTLLATAVREGAFPCAVAECGRSAGTVWRDAFGTLTGEADSPAATTDTVFDLASLTKVLSTTTIAMRLDDAGRVSVSDPVSRRAPAWQGMDRQDVTIADLLAHCSGLTPHLHLYETLSGLREFADAICRLPLEYPPRSQSLYSDLGFILLGHVLEEAGHADLEQQFAGIARTVTSEPLAYRPPRAWRDRTAPTGTDRWRGRRLVGEVHDRNAWALGGRAGHAGLFGTAAAVGAYARAVLRGLLEDDGTLAAPETIRRYAARRVDVPGSTRALGWDTMKATSSCGSRMSPTAIGHTGFTGTSLWIDWERNFYAVLLTNRVHPAGGNDAILRIRPAFHDTLLADPGAPRP